MEHNMFDLAAIRTEYRMKELHEETVSTNPIHQFESWFQEVMDSHIEEPNAMTVSTVGIDGQPSSRVVLLKGVEEGGFIFFTNYNSHKGQNISRNPLVAINFFWKELQRQVRIEGRSEKLEADKSDAYFLSRPYGSQEGAWASPQSEVIASRAVLDERFKKVEMEFREKKMIRPPFWGGYRVIPDLIEFWQGRANRLHDRIRYNRLGEGWKIERLAP